MQEFGRYSYFDIPVFSLIFGAVVAAVAVFASIVVVVCCCVLKLNITANGFLISLTTDLTEGPEEVGRM